MYFKKVDISCVYIHINDMNKMNGKLFSEKKYVYHILCGLTHHGQKMQKN